MSAFIESVVEEAALEWFEALGYTITGGPSIAPGEPGEERRTGELSVSHAEHEAEALA
jgi:type I restriction enzyme R subunit